MEQYFNISLIRYQKDNTRTLRRRTINELIEELNDTRYKDIIYSFRMNAPLLQREHVGDIRDSMLNQMLKDIPMICFSTEIIKTKGEEKIVAHNPLLLLTISNLRSAQKVDDLKEKASLLPYTMMAFTGVDGVSLNIVCRLKPLRKELLDSNDYATLLKKGYASLRMIYTDHLRTSVDIAEPDLMMTCRLSYDTELYYNPLSHPFHVDMLSNTPYPLDANTNMMPAQVENQDEMYEWRRIFINNERKAMEQTDIVHGDNFSCILLMARYCHETGMPQALAERWTMLSRNCDCDDILIRDTFTAEYDKDLSTFDKYRHSNASAQMIMRTSMFLNAHFRFRKNVLNGIVEYRMNDGTDFSYHLLTTEAQNTMTLMALESGLNSWDKDLNRYIHSRRIPEYDPVNTFLDNLPQWDGKDRITDIAQRIPTDTPNWERNFHIWMLSMVAQWMGRDDQHGNAIAPILIGAQATGKSSFCRMLLPETLAPYYNDSINFKDDKSVFLALSSFALINIDEFDSLSRSQQPILKYLLSKTDVKYRAAYRTYIEQHKRYASFIGTTNNPRPLSDPTGSRRFICVHVTGAIDFTTPLDYEQVYAQLRDEVMKGERYWFTKEEADILTKQNSSYQRAGDLRSIITKLFRKPETSEDVKPIPLEEIITEILNRHPEFSSLTDVNMKVGRTMTQMGFEQVRGHSQRRYKAVLK